MILAFAVVSNLTLGSIPVVGPRAQGATGADAHRRRVRAALCHGGGCVHDSPEDIKDHSSHGWRHVIEPVRAALPGKSSGQWNWPSMSLI